MYKPLIATLLAMSSLPLRADFFVQNNTDLELTVSIYVNWIKKDKTKEGQGPSVEIDDIRPRTIKIIDIEAGLAKRLPPDPSSKIWGSKIVIYNASKWGPNVKGEINLKTENHYNLLKNKTVYAPTFVVTHNKETDELNISGPLDEETLKKEKEFAFKKLTKEISRSTQLPHEEGGIAGIISKLSDEPEEVIVKEME